MRSLAQVDTTRGATEITRDKVKSTPTRAEVDVGPGGRAGFYLTFQETGTIDMPAQPFMRPALDHLKGRADVAPKRLGAIGFCMGGSLTQQIALASSDLGAAAAFYGGRGAPEPEELANVRCELLALYGEEDQGIPMDRVEAIRAALERAGKPHEIVVYPGAPHAFFNDTRPSYREEAAKEAGDGTLAVFPRVPG